jgi:hypothetical protein
MSVSNANDDSDTTVVKIRKRNREKAGRSMRATDLLDGVDSKASAKRARAGDEKGDADAEDDAQTTVGSVLEAAKALQETRVRKHGILASNDKDLLDARVAAAAAAGAGGDAAVSLAGGGKATTDNGSLESVFAAQTEVTDKSKLDELREQYVREKLEAEKKKWQEKALAAAAASGGTLDALQGVASAASGAGPARPFDEEQLYIVPAHLRPPEEIKSVAPQQQTWAVGIEEVELPIEHKMRNIEATERAKAELIAQQRSNRRVKVMLAPDQVAADTAAFVQEDEQVPANFSTRRAANSVFSASSAPPLGGKTNVDLDLPPLESVGVDTKLFYRNNAALPSQYVFARWNDLKLFVIAVKRNLTTTITATTTKMCKFSNCACLALMLTACVRQPRSDKPRDGAPRQQHATDLLAVQKFKRSQVFIR